VSSFSDKLRSPPALRFTYTGLSLLYDIFVPTVSSRARTLGLSWLDVEDGEQILEVGTGTGLAFQHLVGVNPRGWTVGVDLTPAMLEQARARISSVPDGCYELREAQATALPYATNTFDAVFSSYLIDVLSSPRIRRFLSEMRRVLRPKGRLVLVYWAPPHRRVERLWSLLAHALPPLFGGARPVTLQGPLRECGFRVLNHTTRVQAGLRSAITRASPS
jgi:ubiquinone/menaquinone biosynthesis C-methylase UbiE